MAINKSKLMDSARKYSDKGQTDKAIKEYLKVVEDDPKDVRVWLKIGDLYAKKGSKDEAAETYLKVAKFYGEQGFYLKAVAVYKQILKLDPRLVEVNLKLAELYRQLGLLSDAMQHFEMVAAHFHREGKTKEALATIRQLVDLDPENVATRIKLAELYSKEGMTEDAVKEFAHACEFLRKQGRSDDFVKVAERLLWHKPDNLALHRELATIYLKRNDARRALQKLQTCFKANPRDLETLAQLAQAFQALDQKAKTVSVLKEMARVLTENGQRAQAEDVHKKILAYAPNDPDSRAFLGAKAGPAPVAAERAAPAPIAASARAGTAEAVMATAVASPAARGAVADLVLGAGQRSAALPRAKPGAMTGALPLVKPEVLEPTETPTRQVDDRLLSELQLEEEPAAAESAARVEAHAEEIAKILTEADVYVKYGLHQKAIEHLRRVFGLDPGNLEARERLKDILLAQGREAEAIVELTTMAEHAGAREPERAAGYLREVLRHDASHARRVGELAARFGLDLDEPSQVSGIEIDGGGVAVVEDELAFDDLDFVPASGAAGRGAPPEPRARGSAARDLEDSDVFEFELEDEPAAARPVEADTSTVEVALDQVEDAVSMTDVEADDLDFDAPAEVDDRVVGRARGYAAAPPLGIDDDLVAEVDGDYAFDPDDARAFDADRGGGGGRSDGDARTAIGSGYAAAGGYADAGYEEADDLVAEVEDDPDEVQELSSVELLSSDLLTAPPDLEASAPLHRGAVPGPDPRLDDALGADGPRSGLEDDLDEADFFVTQGLFAEAGDILRALQRRYPQNPLVAAKLRDLEAVEGGRVPLGTVDGLDDDDVVPAAAVHHASAPTPVARPTDDDLERERRRRRAPAKPAVMLEQPLEDNDADTHFDLGLAYREMGLFDEAIKAFSKARASAGREVQSHHMIGVCQRDQGNLSEAINQFKAGLYVDRITGPEKFGLYYEIGTTYEQLEDPQEALYYYEMVLKKDATYRDVAARVTGIKQAQGSGAQRPHPPNPLDGDADAALDAMFDGEGHTS